MSGDFSCAEIAHHDALGVSIDYDEVKHLGARVHGNSSFLNFFFEGLITADEELLAGLAAGVEGAFHLGTPEGAVIKEASVFASEGNPLGDTLVDDFGGDFG